jgi:hypothetical protein
MVCYPNLTSDRESYMLLFANIIVVLLVGLLIIGTGSPRRAAELI